MPEPTENRQEREEKGQPEKRILLVTYGWQMGAVLYDFD